jgi:hypothetical protein
VKAILVSFVLMTACKTSAPGSSAVQGYENSRRKVGVTGLASMGQSQQFYVTGRTSMGTRDNNQCEAAYVDNEKVSITYQDGGVTKTESLYIAGVNNTSFFGSKFPGYEMNGVITDACGTVLEVTFDVKNGRQPIKMRFVVVDRIYEGHAQDRPNLDIAKEAFYKLRQDLGYGNNFDGMSVRTVAKGSYTYAQNSDCKFEPGQTNSCGSGW